MPAQHTTAPVTTPPANPASEPLALFADFKDMRGRTWEWFIDPCYYDMTCVRPKGVSDFENPLSFHFATSAIAADFVSLLRQSR